MRVQAFTSGAGYGTGYLIWDVRLPEAALIDAPPGVTRRVLSCLGLNNLRLGAIVSTHGHWDSCADCAEMVERTGAPLLAHSWDASRLSNPDLTLEPGSAYKVRGCRADRGLADGEIVEVGSLRLEIWHTPGHSPGSISVYARNQSALFTGDTLLAGQVGRTDLAGGNLEALNKSLMRFAALPPHTRVFPAHGRTTDIKSELWILQLAV
jgi:hydroxyacylglutathione hydrolase